MTKPNSTKILLTGKKCKDSSSLNPLVQLRIANEFNQGYVILMMYVYIPPLPPVEVEIIDQLVGTNILKGKTSIVTSFSPIYCNSCYSYVLHISSCIYLGF